MRIIYYSKSYFADCDFPLIRELQKQGHDVRYYIPIASYNLKSSLIELDTLYPYTGIYNASIYEGLEKYKDEIDMSNFFVVNQKYKQKFHPINILLMIRLCIDFILQKPDVIHLTEEPSWVMKLLYIVKNKLVLTVHDPFMHSSKFNKKDEKNRIAAFKKIPKLILLNKSQVEKFASYYNISREKIFLNKLGSYDTLNRIPCISCKIKRPYILFFGGISKYKGLNILLESMKMVHKKHPELTLVVAGGGKLWFEIEPYKKMEYLKFKLYYVGVSELVSLLNGSLFSICPYIDATQSGVAQTSLTMKVPVIATNVGGLPEVVENGKYGIITKPNDVNALADSINSLYEDKDGLKRMKSNIEKYWIPDMSWKEIAKKYIYCYNEKSY